MAEPKLDPLIVGLSASEVGAVETPIQWKRDVMSYHANSYRLVDPELPEGLEQPYVVLLRSNNPVAREWQLHRLEQSSMYLLQSKARQLTMHDDLLANRLGKEGVSMVIGELLERLPDLISKGLVRAPRNLQPILCGDDDDDPAEVVSDLVRGDLHIVSRKCFYGKPEERLRCIVPEKHWASEDEQLKQYRSSHEQKAVSVPLTMWNRRCEAE